MTDRKLVFLDVDGTLVDYRNTIPASAVDAVREARERGHLVFVCTGRSKAEVYDELWEIGLDGLVGGNGSYAEYRDEVVLEQTMTAEQCRRVVDWLHERGLEFYLECNAGLFGSENFETAAQPTIRDYVRGKGTTDVESLTVRDVFPDMIFGADLYRTDVNKISFILSSVEDHHAATRDFPTCSRGRGAAAVPRPCSVTWASRTSPRPTRSSVWWSTWAPGSRTPSVSGTPRWTFPCWRCVVSGSRWATGARTSRPWRIM